MRAMGNTSTNGDTIAVSFMYENTGKQAKFPAQKDAKFDDVVNEAYKELGEQRKPSDNFLCMNGAPLDGDLDKALQYVVDNVCKEASFRIKGKSGGALFYFDEP